MSRVMTFSRVFPSYHPKAGEPTYFVEKIWESIKMKDPDYISQFIWGDWLDQKFEPKHHTIRAGHRWKVGDKFSPRVRSGKPYQSKQIIIAPDIEVKKVWNIRIDYIVHWIDSSGRMFAIDDDELAKNDGLGIQDFVDWFDTRNGPFIGQIICWNDSIEY